MIFMKLKEVNQNKMKFKIPKNYKSLNYKNTLIFWKALKIQCKQILIQILFA